MAAGRTVTVGGVRMVTVSGADVPLVPSTLVAIAVNEYVPSVSGVPVVAILHVVPVLVTNDPLAVPLTNMLTVLPASLSPVIVGVVTLVMLSSFVPLSLAGSSVRAVGAAGGAAPSAFVLSGSYG